MQCCTLVCLQKKIDCRGHLIYSAGGGEESLGTGTDAVGEAGSGTVENPFHLVVIVSWLLVKEGSNLMAALISQCSLPVLGTRGNVVLCLDPHKTYFRAHHTCCYDCLLNCITARADVPASAMALLSYSVPM